MIMADNPWKEICDKKLMLVLELLFDRLYQMLNWTRDYEPVDQELRRFTPASEMGGRIADRLIKAFAKHKGEPRFLHLEVQGKKERGFRRRIHECNLRAEERFGTHVISMVVLTDENLTWRPSCYVGGQLPMEDEPAEAEQPAATRIPVEERPGEAEQDFASGKKKRKRKRYHDERTLRWLLVKLLDYRGREAELEAMDNPVGVIIVAHLEAMRTRENPKECKRVKLRLLKNLRARKMDEEDTRLWFTCVDFLLQLPEDLERAVRLELELLDKEDSMPYLSFIERQALDKGIEKGIEKGQVMGARKNLRAVMKAKFGDEGAALVDSLAEATDPALLESLCVTAALAANLDQVRSLLPAINGSGSSNP